MLVVEHDASLAHERKRFGRELEPDDPHTYLGVWRVVGAAAWPMVGDEFLDLTQVLTGRSLAPRCLGRGRGHARQLADRRERELAMCECRRELRQRSEGARNPQPILCNAWPMIQGRYQKNGGLA